MNQLLIEKIVSDFHKVSKFKIDLNSMINTFIEYDDEIQPIDIHHEIQNIVNNALKADPKVSHQFDIQAIEDSNFNYLKKHIIMARKDELKVARIVISRKKYDITELRSTYYGKLILKDIPEVGNRRLLNFEEYKIVKEAFLKLNLDLPEEIRPTTTEKLFSQVFGDDDDE